MQNLKPGDHVAIVSPSAPLAAIFPHVFELGLSRIKTIFNLNPVVMPFANQLKVSFEEKAKDLHEAFSNPKYKAVISVIGGNDQIKLIPYLNPKIFIENPKPFFGYSDNTNLHHFLLKHQIKSFYGGAVLTQFAMQSSMYQHTINSLNWAFFSSDTPYELRPSTFFNDIDLSWDDPSNLTKKRVEEENEGFIWDLNENTENIKGLLWGGCLESLDWLFKIPGRSIDFEKLKKSILFLETSEEMPSSTFVARFLISLGESGVLKNINGLLIGRPKTWNFSTPLNHEEKITYKKEQQKTILKVFREYNQTAPIIQNLDFGHTDPQGVLVHGGKISIDVKNKKLMISKV